MSLAIATFEDLLADFELTAAKWKEFFRAHPGAAEVATDIAGTGTVAGLVGHIYAAAVRNSERLIGDPVTELGAVNDLAAAWELEAKAAANLERFMAGADEARMAEVVHVKLRMGEMDMSRRKMCLHIFVHTIRHWAQVGPLVRQNGFPVGWPQDILFSEAIR